MGILVYKSHYVRGGANVKNYVTYIGTRPGVIKIAESRKNEAATTNQNLYIKSFLEAQPEINNSPLYKIYQENRTLGNASELISFIEETYEEEQVQGIEGYLQYMATRPGAVKVGTNGLFSDEDGFINMEEVKRQLIENKGVIFTPIISLTRDDAESFGYTSPKVWQNLIKSHRNEIAELYRIDPENFEWYGAFHNEPNHPHIHLIFYSKDGKQGWQNPNYTFEKMKRLLSTDIIRPYRQQIYGQKNVLRQDIKQTSKVKMDELIVKISQKEDYPENTYRMLMMLREELNKQKGKRVYGYLPQHVKSLVDNIVDELAKDPDISELLKHWNTLQGNLIALYKKDGYNPIPLSQMSEFKSVKNMIIQEAMNIPDDEFVPVSTKEITDDKPSVRNQHKTHFFSNLSIVFRRICNNSQPKQGKEKNQIEQDEEYERKLAQGMKM